MLRYTVEMKPGGFTKEEVGDNDGCCDALVLVSVMREGKKPHNGPVSYAIRSVDSVGYQGGDWAEIPPTEMFSVMNCMASGIADNESAPSWQRSLCRQMVEATRERLVGKDNEPPSEFCDNFQIGFAIVEGHVVMKFRQSVETVGYEPDDARRLGQMLINLADEAEASLSKAH